MITAIAQGSTARSSTERLAEALYMQARWALEKLPATSKPVCLATLETFVANPSPATYVRAHHTLALAVSQHLSQTVFGSNQARAFADGIAALQNVAVIPQSDLACLERDLPVDALAGTRLADLATLLQIWRELAGRTDEELDRLRALKQSSRPGRRPNRSR